MGLLVQGCGLIGICESREHGNSNLKAKRVFDPPDAEFPG